MARRLRPGDQVADLVGAGGDAEVLERAGEGVTGEEYVRVRWTDGGETTEPVWRFGEDCS